jgi:elongation factor G
MGDAHIDTVIRRMQGRFSVNLIPNPQSAFKETVTTSATPQYRHKKQSAAPGSRPVHMRSNPRCAIRASFLPGMWSGVASPLLHAFH